MHGEGTERVYEFQMVVGFLERQDLTSGHENVLYRHAFFQHTSQNQAAIETFGIMGYKNIVPLLRTPEVHEKKVLTQFYVLATIVDKCFKVIKNQIRVCLLWTERLNVALVVVGFRC